MTKKTTDASTDQTAEDGAAPEDSSGAPVAAVVPSEAVKPELDIKDGADQSEGLPDGPPDEEDGREGEGGQHVHAPYGFRADGVTPKAKPGRPPKDVAAAQAREQQRARLRSVTPGQGKPQKQTPIAVTPLAVVNYEAMGQAVASMWFNGGEMLLGPEWAPNTQEGEHTAVAGAFATYFKAVQMKDLPPGIALCFVLGIYTLKRATKPTVKSKLELFGAWVKSKMAFGRRGLSLVTRRDQVQTGSEVK
jgi:hypothetical protein